MTNNQLRILLSLRDEASIKLRKFDALTKRAVNEMKRHWLKLTIAVAAFTFAIIKVSKALIGASSTVEQYRTRLNILLKSVEEGNKVFADMEELAARVPKTYDEIMASATDLSAVVRGGSEEIKQLMPMIVDLSAGTGIAVREVTGQVIKMYGAGAAAADMFRERGISAALGFQAKVSYTSEETMNTLIKQWEDGTGKYVDAAVALAETWEGVVSMMQDAWLQFKIDIGAELFEAVKTDLKVILLLMKASKEEGGKYRDVVEELSDFFSDAYENAKSLGVTTLVTGAEMVDIWNRVRIVFLQAQGGIETIAEKSIEAYLWALKLYSLGTINIFGKKHLDEVELSLAAVRAGMEKTAEAIIKIEERAEVDHSEKMKARLEKLGSFFEEQRAVIEEKEAELLELKTSSAETGEEEVQSKIISAQEKTVDKLRDLWQAWSDEKLSIEMGRLQRETEFYKLAIDTQKKANESMWVVVGKMKDTFAKSLSKTFVDMIKGTGSVKKSFEALGYKMIEILIDFAIQRAINAALGKALLAAQTTATMAAGTATAAAWAPAAAMVSLATFGANAGPASAALASIAALAQVLAVPALEQGGIIPGSSRGTLVLAGEGNKSEAIIPLSKGGFGGQTFNIEINNPIIDNDERIDELVEEVSYRLAQERR